MDSKEETNLKIQKYADSFKRANQDPEIINLAEEGLNDYLEMLVEHESEQINHSPLTINKNGKNVQNNNRYNRIN